MKGILAQWMESNPIGFVLGIVTVVLLTVGAVLTLFWRSGDALSQMPENVAAVPLPELPVRAEGPGPIGDYEEVNSRPLFNAGRRPIVIAEVAVEEAPEPESEAPQAAPPPDLRLTGVIITPEQRLVTLTPEKGGEALVVGQGKPLEGEYFGWRVGEIEPRSVKLRAAGGQTISKELTVYDRPITAPPKPKPQVKEQVGRDANEPSEQSPSRADEIRERIRQRREQMRSEAEQEEQGRESSTEDKRASYRDAIQALMASQNEQDAESDNEEASGDE